MNSLETLLKKLYTEFEVKGETNINITGLSANSKETGYGNIFIAKKGLSTDGHQYINEAIAAGAAVIVTDIYNPFIPVTQIITKNIQALEAELAFYFYDNASSKLKTTGITGTNGKTSCSYLIKHILDKNKVSCGMIGSIEYHIGSRIFPSKMTTPDVITNHKLLNMMCDSKCQAAVMEVSSHALTQHRTAKIDFDVAVYTNLSQDHLDYHIDMDSYAKAKAMLFSSLKEQSYAIINIDDPYATVMLSHCNNINIITYGLCSNADFYASNIVYGEDKTSFDIISGDIKARISWPLLGRHNIYNALASIAAASTLKIPIYDIIKSMRNFNGAPGRLERINIGADFHVFVDSAATEDALKNTFQALTSHPRRRIITVFGCGGDRDTSKRPKMAAACEKYSDYCIVTNDNPRREDPDKIIQDIVKGFSDTAFEIEKDRELAIAKALSIALPGDILLIAGRGHEIKQIFAHKTIEFDDRAVIKNIYEQLKK